LADTAGFRVFGEGKGGRFVVLLRGEDRRDIAVTLRAGRTDSVWVASRSLPAGTVIRSTDLRRAVHLVWGPPAGAVDPPLGWEVRRAVHSGEPLVGAALIEPVVIRAGDRVRFAWERGQVRIVREGIAQARARRGQSVWARDLIRGERLEGIATGPGQARPARGSP
jgi:flagella basal body P-ring formation protein FlgA